MRIPALFLTPRWRGAWTLLLSLTAAELFVGLGTPLPWMLGPMLATGLVSVVARSGARPFSWGVLRNAGQCTIGVALGLYFTPQVAALVLGLWWAIVLSIMWALALGLVFGAWLHRQHAHRLPGLNRATTYFAGGIGAASEMTLLAERAHGRTDLVAAAHSMRLLIVTILIPFAMQFGQFDHLDLLAGPQRPVQWGGLALLLLAASAGAWVMHWLDRANPWFMGPLLVAMGLTVAGIELSAVPRELVNAAQLVIGISLGVRFTPEFVHTAPRWLGSVAVGTLVLIGVCAGFAVLLAWGTHLPLATLILGTAPGGIAEMAITAKVLQLGAPVVTAFQACRLIAVLVLLEPIYRWRYGSRRPG